MFKYLLIGLLVWLIVIPALKRALGHRPTGRGEGPKAAPPAPASGTGAQPMMVRCAHCGVHLPESDAQRDAAGRPYCCVEHARSGPGAV
ncbi:PP0621 family protein [uncultured Aquabacterium sp.]|uniref:PP0621 family protein n=1 Tax=Aquabacterium sp. TaxID=1872578 RepID=UPI0025F95899|nr:PP0621 family protein [uncultured Aquabacterium sp.]